jgi:hypothetical protein
LNNNRILEESMKSLKNSLLLSLAASGLLLAATAAKADPLSLTITPVFQTGTDGGMLTFDATLTDINPTEAVYLNSDITTLSGPLVLDDSPFFNNFPLFLDPGGSFTAELFTVFIPNGTPDGLYTGTFNILGGSPSDFTDVVASANFDVGITPEPTSFVLLLTGLLTGLVMIGLLRYRAMAGRQLAG